jgi:preprotein translocase subunit SecE
MNLFKYFSEVIGEVKKVSWPTTKRTAEMTTLVIVISVLLAFYTGSLDFIFSQLMKFFIK